MPLHLGKIYDAVTNDFAGSRVLMMMFRWIGWAFVFVLCSNLLGSPLEASDWLPEERPDDAAVEAKTPDDIPLAEPEYKPLWEVVAGGGIGWTPDYPAAGQNHFRGIPPIPLPVYRGENFQAGERSFARGLFINTPQWELDLSFSGSLPADSSDNDARDGMDDLDFLGEVGPSLSYYFDRDDAGNQRRIEIAVRAVLSTDFSNFDYVGLVFHPYFAQEFVDVYDIEGLDTNWSIGARWANNGVMDLFYEVPLEDANDDRDAFDAEAGYLGSNLYGAFSYTFTDYFRLAVGSTLASYHGATNQDSDLFIDKVNFAVGVGLIFTLWKSETRSKIRL